jgi:Cu(I)/Ag(I) efflux system membrane fusion protein
MMKTKSTIGLFVITIIAVLTACNPARKETAHDHTAAAADSSADSTPQFAVAPAFQQQLTAVFTAYIKLKDAFVASDTARIQTQATALQGTLATTDMKLLEDAAHHDWMTYLDGLTTSLKKIQNTPDIETQRQAFSTFTHALYQSIKAFGLSSTTAYYDFCPMAFNNQGGFWLSDQPAIRNPYFGDRMLTCGQIQEKL